MLNYILYLILIVCLVSDMLYRKIYNKVIVPGLIVSIILNVYYYGKSGIIIFIFGFIVGAIILIVPYMFGGMGAGDVKLLALIGSFKGYIFVINTSIYMAFIGGIISISIILFNKSALKNIKSILNWIILIESGFKTKLDISKLSFDKKFPYGIAIVGGAFICLLIEGSRIL